MSAVEIKLDPQLAKQVQRLGRSLDEAVPELIVLELYRRGQLSSGKAAELLDMERFAFIHYASRLGLPFFEMSAEEWAQELEGLESA